MVSCFICFSRSFCELNDKAQWLAAYAEPRKNIKTKTSNYSKEAPKADNPLQPLVSQFAVVNL
jgi:hypothetical protein